MKRNTWMALFQREWLQHRWAWALMAGLPLALGLLLVSFGSIELDDDEAAQALPLAMTVGSMAITMISYLTLAVLAAVVLLAGLARRDHADRSVEFWLSLPTGHTGAWAVPLITHGVLVPMLALPLGALAGAMFAPVLVARTEGLQAWTQLPWSQLLPATLAVVGRIMAGVPLAAIWLAPVALLMVLLTAWLGRWGLVVLAGGFGIATAVLDRLWNTPWPAQALQHLLENAAVSLLHATSQPNKQPFSASDPIDAMAQVPGLLLPDFFHSLALLAQPSLLPVLAMSAACLAGLVWWRRGGAGTHG